MKSKAEESYNEKQDKTAKAAAMQKSFDKSGLRMADNGEASDSQAELQMMIEHSPRMIVQRKQIERSFDTSVQRQGPEEEEELLQGKFRSGRADTVQAKLEESENKTGMPDNLKAGLENLSGISMDDVKVHYNSSKPADIHAHAFTQGTDIHIASGQEKHLPHEGWHVVQQVQGRVKPTMQLKDGVPANDDQRLEHEADEMGARALQMRRSAKSALGFPAQPVSQALAGGIGNQVVQRIVYNKTDDEYKTNSGLSITMELRSQGKNCHGHTYGTYDADPQAGRSPKQAGNGGVARIITEEAGTLKGQQDVETDTAMVDSPTFPEGVTPQTGNLIVIKSGAAIQHSAKVIKASRGLFGALKGRAFKFSDVVVSDKQGAQGAIENKKLNTVMQVVRDNTIYLYTTTPHTTTQD